ncbi:MAG TPA: LacI family DNA-binding transcriptional regulator, partial [Anaerolineales bacterium]|nr:LacI family DNA-binding transcriptional regulator [Anaerolineales bacterium]
MPNSLARQLSTGRTLTIGIIQPYITLPSYIERLKGVQHILASSEYDLVIFNVENPDQKDAYFRDLSRKMRVDGMLIVSLPPTNEQADNFNASRIPTVLIDSAHAKLCCIVADDLEGGRLATRHLAELGHRKIAFLSDYLDTPFHPAMRLRYLGYREVLEQYGIPFNPAYVIEGNRGRINARTMAKKLLLLDDPPTAIFASSDTQALGILDITQEMGLKVPERLSVIGYDNIPDAVYNNLSTIDQSLYDSGVKGAQMLLELLSGTMQAP